MLMLAERDEAQQEMVACESQRLVLEGAKQEAQHQAAKFQQLIANIGRDMQVCTSPVSFTTTDVVSVVL
jgi:hypothetical protein